MNNVRLDRALLVAILAALGGSIRLISEPSAFHRFFGIPFLMEKDS